MNIWVIFSRFFVVEIDELIHAEDVSGVIAEVSLRRGAAAAFMEKKTERARRNAAGKILPKKVRPQFPSRSLTPSRPSVSSNSINSMERTEGRSREAAEISECLRKTKTALRDKSKVGAKELFGEKTPPRKVKSLESECAEHPLNKAALCNFLQENSPMRTRAQEEMPHAAGQSGNSSSDEKPPSEFFGDVREMTCRLTSKTKNFSLTRPEQPKASSAFC